MRIPSIVRHETWPITKDTSSTCEHVSLSERVRARLTSYRKLRASSADRCSQPVLRPSALDRSALERQSFCTITRGRAGSTTRSLTPIPVPSVSAPQHSVTSSCAETKMEDCEVQMRPHKQQLLRSPCKRSAATRRSMSYDVPQVSTSSDVDRQSELSGPEAKHKWQSLESILDAGESVSRRSSVEGPPQNKLYRRGMYCDSSDDMVTSSPVTSPVYTAVIPRSLRRRSRSLSALDEPDYAEIEEEDDEEGMSPVLDLHRSHHADENFVNPLHCLNGVLPGYYNALHQNSSGAYAVPPGSEMGSASSSDSSTTSNTPVIRCGPPPRDVSPYSIVNICPDAASPGMPPPPVPSKQRPSLAAQNNEYMTPSSASVSSESSSGSSGKHAEAMTLTVRDQTSGAPICLVDVSFAADSSNNNMLSRPLDFQKILESSSEQAVRTPLGTISLRARAPMTRPEVMSHLVVPREPQCAGCHRRPVSAACKQDVSTGTRDDSALPNKRRSRSPLAGLHSLFSFRKHKS